MKTLLIIILCSLPLIGNGQEKITMEWELVKDTITLNLEEYQIIIKPYIDRLLLMQDLVEGFETLLEIKENETMGLKLKFRVMEGINDLLLKQYQKCQKQDSIRRSNELDIRFGYPVMIQDEPIFDTIIYQHN